MVLGALFLAPALPNGLIEARTASNEALGAVIYLGLVPSFIAYGSWAIALSRLSAARASNFLYCVPPVATAMGYFWLGEIPSALELAGGILALGGVVVVNLRRRA
jgi:drug/metabolite transporter (DMT)-like permease